MHDIDILMYTVEIRRLECDQRFRLSAALRFRLHLICACLNPGIITTEHQRVMSECVIPLGTPNHPKWFMLKRKKHLRGCGVLLESSLGLVWVNLDGWKIYREV